MTNKILLPPFRRARNRSKLVIGVGVAACSLHARGQEALRESIIGENAALVRRERAAAENYNIKAGPVNLRFDSILDAEFNDNINVSDQFAQSDFIFRPHLNMRTLWQVTPQNALDLNIGVGYTKYISHPRYDRLLITPDSELEFDLSIKEYQISFHDRISYSQNVIDQGSVSGDQATANHAALYGGLSNVGGVDVGRNYGRLSWTVGYDHSSFQASSSFWVRLNKESELFFWRGRYVVNETLLLGSEVSGAINVYEKQNGQNLLNDSTSYSLGVFSKWKVSTALDATARLGYVAYNFNRTGTISKSSNVASPYAELSLRHAMNEYINHSLGVSRHERLGVYSDAVSIYDVNYGIAVKIIRDLPLAASIFYERGRDNNLTVGETADRFGFNLNARYDLTKKTDVSLNYRFASKDSSRQSRSYAQNSVLLTLHHQF